jgi:hypothetical protein
VAGAAVAVAVAAAAVRFREMNAPCDQSPCWVALTPFTVKLTLAPIVPQPAWVLAEATSTEYVD